MTDYSGVTAPPMLSSVDLTVEYPGFRLNIPSFTVRSGELLGLLGNNGAGKSTLLKALAGVIPVGRRSKVWCDGKELDFAHLNETVSLIAENHPLYGWMRAEQYIQFASRFYATWDSTHCARLCERLRLPLNKKIDELSKGTRLKVALVAALSHHPRVLLLDEATSGLDLASRSEILSELDVLRNEGAAIVLSSHIVDDLESCATSISILVEGEVKLSSPKPEITSQWVVHPIEPGHGSPNAPLVRSDQGKMIAVLPKGETPPAEWGRADQTLWRAPSLRELFLAIGGR